MIPQIALAQKQDLLRFEPSVEVVSANHNDLPRLILLSLSIEKLLTMAVGFKTFRFGNSKCFFRDKSSCHFCVYVCICLCLLLSFAVALFCLKLSITRFRISNITRSSSAGDHLVYLIQDLK